MNKNVSNTDRLVRLGIGVVLFVVAFVVGIGSIAGIILAVVAAIAVVTAAVGFCPLYRLFGISTSKASVSQ